MGKEVYNRIKAVLVEQGKRDNWLADKSGLNRITVSKWYRIEMKARIENLFPFAKVPDLNVRELLITTKS